MRPAHHLLALAALAATPALGAAQLLDPRPSTPRAPWGYFGANLTIGQPVAEFSDYVNNAVGGSGYFIVNLDRQGILGLRIDGGFLNYGNETQEVPLSSTIGGRIRVDLTTSNNIVNFGVGPQLTFPSGPIRPYIAGGIGGAYFVTSSSVRGIDEWNEDDGHFNTTNFDDWTWSYSGAGGLLVPIGAWRTPISLDLGARYHSNGRVAYLREGDIIDLPNGDIEMHPVRSRADLVTYHIGVRVGIR